MDRDVNAAKNILARARIVVAGWSPTEKSMWSNDKSLRVRKSGLKARERKRAPVGAQNVSV